MDGSLILALGLGLGVSAPEVSPVERPGFDPLIDQARLPPRGIAIGLGLDRQSDTLGFWLELRSPRFLDDRFAISVAGSIGWFPELPGVEEDSPGQVRPWSPFGQARMRLELALPMAENPHRIFMGVGPSVLFPRSDVSTTSAGLGVHGTLGVELFAGDRYRVWPASLLIEAGAAAHLARADAGLGEAENARTLATGFVLSVGLRWYAFEPKRRSRTSP